MDAEPRTASHLRQRLPHWRWLYGGGVWAGAMFGVADMAGLDHLIADEAYSGGQLSSSGALILGLTMTASLLLGALVQRLWPSSLAYRLFVPAVVLALTTLLLLLSFGEVDFDGGSIVGLGMFLAWLAGVVLADPAARIKPAAVQVVSRGLTAPPAE